MVVRLNNLRHLNPSIKELSLLLGVFLFVKVQLVPLRVDGARDGRIVLVFVEVGEAHLLRFALRSFLLAHFHSIHCSFFCFILLILFYTRA